MKRVFFVLLSAPMLVAQADDRLEFWNTQRVGANGDGADATEDWFRSAASAGVEFVRLSVAGMTGARRDFLIGDADDWRGIPPEDLHQLVTTLDRAQKHGVRVVITMFSVPGRRWRQHNDNKHDYRLWHSPAFQEDVADFWRELAGYLKDHPAVVGYNVMNEPAPEREHGFEELSPEFVDWVKAGRNTSSDLDTLYRRVIRAVRSVDTKTPVILDCCFHAHPTGMTTLQPISDPAVLYSFHFYEPWNFTTYRINKNRFQFPGRMPQDWAGRKTVAWSSGDLASRMSPVVKWARRNKIPANRILAGEFGCDRRVGGAAQYLEQTIAALNERDWHWAFYSYRSRSWDGMDYELGTKPLGGKYWQARESGESHEALISRGANPVWDVISDQLRPRK